MQASRPLGSDFKEVEPQVTIFILSRVPFFKTANYALNRGQLSSSSFFFFSFFSLSFFIKIIIFYSIHYYLYSPLPFIIKHFWSSSEPDNNHCYFIHYSYYLQYYSSLRAFVWSNYFLFRTLLLCNHTIYILYFTKYFLSIIDSFLLLCTGIVKGQQHVFDRTYLSP